MHRLWPISREATIGSRLLLMRAMPWDVVLADRAVIDVLMRIPSHLKLNSEVWNIAVARICRGVRDVRNANFGVTIGSSRRINAAEFLVSVGRRKIARLLGRDRFSAFALATAGSWPNFRYYMLHSPLLAALWNGTPREHRELLSDLLGFDPWSLTLHDWADRDVNQWYRLMTLRIWLAQR
jgi:asparagine synthase (glutamine-hydrolysing)